MTTPHSINTLEVMSDMGHERVCFHQDEASGLQAIIAIHSTRLGNALGGTRRWHYATEQEGLIDVLRLSQGMSYKSACAGLPMGGAKSVILLPEQGWAATEAEARAMGRFIDTLNGVYIGAEDVGTSIQYIDWMAKETKHVKGGETVCDGGDPSPWTAKGTFNGIKACLSHAGRGNDLGGLRVAIQGIGHVGMVLAELLHDAGAELIVADIHSHAVQQAVDRFGATPCAIDTILASHCDVLAPCALGGVLGRNEIAALQTDIVCGASNNILVNPDRDAQTLAERGIVYGPDFVVNAGGLIHLAGLYLGLTEADLLERNDAIECTTAHILEDADGGSTYAAAVALAQTRIAAGDPLQEQCHAG
jgi:leucine dehydrogenase